MLYFTEADIKELFKRVADRFPAAWIAFDRISTYSIQYLQADLSHNNLDAAKIQWGIDKAAEIEAWDHRFKIVAEERMFEGIDRKMIVDAGVAKIMDMNDQYNGSGIVILTCT